MVVLNAGPLSSVSGEPGYILYPDRPRPISHTFTVNLVRRPPRTSGVHVINPLSSPRSLPCV
jgi:hypothetical protein